MRGSGVSAGAGVSFRGKLMVSPSARIAQNRHKIEAVVHTYDAQQPGGTRVLIRGIPPRPSFCVG